MALGIDNALSQFIGEEEKKAMAKLSQKMAVKEIATMPTEQFSAMAGQAAQMASAGEQSSLDQAIASMGDTEQQPVDLGNIIVEKPQSSLEQAIAPQMKTSSLEQAVSSPEKQLGSNGKSKLGTFLTSVGHSMLGMPVEGQYTNEQGKDASWINYLGANIGNEIKDMRVTQNGVPVKTTTPEFYNTAQERAKSASELEKSAELQKIKDDLEVEKIKKSIEALGGRVKPKTISSSGDITFDYVPTDEEAAAENKRAVEKEKLKPPTEGMSKARTFALRMQDANKTLSDIDSSGKFSAIETATQSEVNLPFGIKIGAPNVSRSPKIQKFDQAKRNFVTALLRRESGAAISPEEFATADQQYFRQPGDHPDTVKQKAANRKRVIEEMAKEAGRAFSEKERQADTSDPLGIR